MRSLDLVYARAASLAHEAYPVIRLQRCSLVLVLLACIIREAVIFHALEC